MYSYLPAEYLVKGLSLGELIYKNLDNDLKSNPDYVNAALKADAYNIEFVPVEFIIEKSKDKNFSLKKFVDGLDASFSAMNTFAVNVAKNKNMLEMHKSFFNNFFRNEKVILEVIWNNYNNNALQGFLNSLDASHPLLTDVDFLKSVLKKFYNEECGDSFEIIHCFKVWLIKKAPQVFEDIDVMKFFVKDQKFSRFDFVNFSDKWKNPENLMVLLKTVFPEGVTGKWISSAISILYNNKEALKNEKFVKELMLLVLSKQKDIELDEMLQEFPPSVQKNYGLVLEVLKSLDEKGVNINYGCYYINSLRKMTVSNPELVKFLVNKVDSFIELYLDRTFYSGKVLKKAEYMPLISMIEPENFSKSVKSTWFSIFDELDEEMKSFISYDKKLFKKDSEIFNTAIEKLKQKFTV